jgi:hypothetical protein
MLLSNIYCLLLKDIVINFIIIVSHFLFISHTYDNQYPCVHVHVHVYVKVVVYLKIQKNNFQAGVEKSRDKKCKHLQQHINIHASINRDRDNVIA